MNCLPIFLDLAGRQATVVGGGTAAARRLETFLAAGARVVVLAERLHDEFAPFTGRFTHASDAASYRFDGCLLCFFAPENGEADPSLIARARAAGAMVNVADSPAICDFIMPSIVDRSPLVVAISTGGASPVLGRMLKARLEAMIPSAYGRLAAVMGAARAPLQQKLQSSPSRLRFWERVLDGPIAEMVLAGDETKAADALAKEIGQATEEGTSGSGGATGEVYLVGAGPGDPDLLTFRAFRLMQKADVVLYDRLVDASILEKVRRDAERIYVGKRRNDHALPQEEIGELLVKLARQGKRVLRLKGGDPFIFGRGGEEIEKLAEHGVPFQVCPGVTAASGCSAYSGIPLTHRDYAQSCVFVTGHGKDGPIELDWETLLRPRQTVAIYMGLAHLELLTAQFIARGADPRLPAAIIENGTRATQKTVTGCIADIAAKASAAQLRGPTIIIIGHVVALRDKLNWFAPQNAIPLPATAAEFIEAREHVQQ